MKINRIIQVSLYTVGVILGIVIPFIVWGILSW